MTTKKSHAKTKSNSKKSTGKSCSCSCNCKIISLILGIVVVGLLATIIFLAKNQKTYEEEKRLQAFETLANSYIDELSMYSEENREGKTATLTGIGITDDNDLYFDFTITKYDNHVPVSTQDGRLHFQCDDRSGKMIGVDAPDGCAKAYSYGEEVATSAELQETYRQYLEDAESAINLCNETQTEDESGNVAYSEECDTKRKEIIEKYTKFFEELQSVIRPQK